MNLEQFIFLQSDLVITYTPKDFFHKLITENIAIHTINEGVENKLISKLSKRKLKSLRIEKHIIIGFFEVNYAKRLVNM